MSTGRPPSRVVVMGRDVDLWLCAGQRHRPGAWPGGRERDCGRAPDSIDVLSERSAPLYRRSKPFHTKLGIKEPSLIRATAGSFSFGQNFVAGPRARPGLPISFMPGAPYGAAIDARQCILSVLAVKATRAWLEDFVLKIFASTAVAASKNGRMLLPDEGTSAFGRTDYGYHLQTIAYAGYLKSTAANLGVKMINRRKKDSSSAMKPDRSPRSSSMGSLRIEGQLFVDAIGPDAILIGQSLDGPASRIVAAIFQRRSNLYSARAPAFTKTPPFAEIRCTGAWLDRASSKPIRHRCPSCLLERNSWRCRRALEVGVRCGSRRAGLRLSFHAVNTCVRAKPVGRQLRGGRRIRRASSIQSTTSIFMHRSLASCTCCPCFRSPGSSPPNERSGQPNHALALRAHTGFPVRVLYALAPGSTANSGSVPCRQSVPQALAQQDRHLPRARSDCSHGGRNLFWPIAGRRRFS